MVSETIVNTLPTLKGFAWSLPFEQARVFAAAQPDAGLTSDYYLVQSRLTCGRDQSLSGQL